MCHGTNLPCTISIRNHPKSFGTVCGISATEAEQPIDAEYVPTHGGSMKFNVRPANIIRRRRCMAMQCGVTILRWRKFIEG